MQTLADLKRRAGASAPVSPHIQSELQLIARIHASNLAQGKDKEAEKNRGEARCLLNGFTDLEPREVKRIVDDLLEVS